MLSRSEVERLYDAHAGRLFGFLVYRTGDHHLAEDLLADVFERALRAAHRFRADRGDEAAWLYTIALNLLRDHHRRARSEQRATSSVSGELGLVQEEDLEARFVLNDEVARAVATLGDEERLIVALRFGADLTAPQIAQVTGLPLTLVEGRLYRALRRLRTTLER